MGQRILVSESEKNKILNMHKDFKNNLVISEQKMKGKLYFAFDNDTTDFQGFIGSDGYLYPYAEDFTAWKVGPIAKVPYTGQVVVRIDKRNGKESIMVSNRGFGNLGKLEMDPNYTVTKVNYDKIPKK
jgi:hypothetical protein